MRGREWKKKEKRCRVWMSLEESGKQCKIVEVNEDKETSDEEWKSGRELKRLEEITGELKKVVMNRKG